MKSGHVAHRCRSQLRCHKCNNRHHVSICDTPPPPPPAAAAAAGGTDPPGQGNAADPTHQINVAPCTNSNTLLQTAQCIISSDTAQEKIRVLLDICAQRTFINENLCEKLQLPFVGWDTMILNAFQTESEEAKKIKIVEAQLKNLSGEVCGVVRLHVVPKICSALSQQTIEVAQSMHKHLQNLPLADFAGGNDRLDVQVLIGGDQYWNFVTGKVFRGFGGPVAMETVFGWVLSGPVQGFSQRTSANLVSTHVLTVGCEQVVPVNIDSQIVEKIHEFWDTENLGLSATEDRVMKEFNESITFDGSNYHVPILFQCDPSVLPDNF